MIYVGVENSRAKSRIAGRNPVQTISVNATDLAWDCQRHIGFLREAVARGDREQYNHWMLLSPYAGWLLHTGRTEAEAVVRCQNFLAHFVKVRAHGIQGPWATVTEDGIRLDGSHRAAIAVVLGMEQVPVAVVPYLRTDWNVRHQWRALRERRIREEGACQEATARA